MKIIKYKLTLVIGLLIAAPLHSLATFSDVASDHINLDAINYVESQGIVEGYADGTYKPDRNINRAEFTKILVESQFDKAVISACSTSSFPDVPQDEWFTPYVCVAHSEDIIAGYPDGTFQPSRDISFVEAAKVISNTFGFHVTADEVWYKPFVINLEEKNSIPVSIKEFSQNITRGEMAEMIYRLKAGITDKPSETYDMLMKEMYEIVEEVTEVPEISFESTREIEVTDGVKHSVPLEAIVGGGPPKDGIPSIDNPEFVSVSEANKYIDDDGLGIAITFNGIDRFYPNQILVWHEIVNDNVGGTDILVSYCPLCGTGIVYKPEVKGKVTEFGTSGKLWNSNLVMYDRQTDSYWSQVLGEAIVGEMTGTKLELLPYDNIFYDDWKRDHPNGEVLSRETGFVRDYNRDPYGSYSTNRSIYFPVDNVNDDIHPKEITFGIGLNGAYKAYTLTELTAGPADFEDLVGGITLNIEFNKLNNTIDIRRTSDNAEVIPSYGFWFSWFSVHPNTEIYEAK